MGVVGCHQLVEDNTPMIAHPPVFPGKDWLKVAEPETYGWSAQRLNEAREYAERIKSDAVVVIDDGRLIAAWGNQATVSGYCLWITATEMVSNWFPLTG